MNEQEFVEVKLRVPKKTDEWMRKEHGDVESRYQWELWDSLRATIEAREFLSAEGKEAHQALVKAIADLKEDPGSQTGKTVKVEIEVPERVLEFLRDMEKLSDLDVAEYLQECIIKSFLADVDTMSEETPFWTLETLKAKYGLEKVDEK